MPRGVTILFTGLSGAGKTTVAQGTERILISHGLPVERLDGDDIRRTLCRDLGFSTEDRRRNIERVAFVANLLTRHGVIVLCSLIAPYQEMRDRLRQETKNYLEVYCKCPIEVTRQRDVKGLYKKTMAGQIKNFTGISDQYEEPENPDLVLYTDKETVGESIANVCDLLCRKGYLGILKIRPLVCQVGRF